MGKLSVTPSRGKYNRELARRRLPSAAIPSTLKINRKTGESIHVDIQQTHPHACVYPGKSKMAASIRARQIGKFSLNLDLYFI